MPSEFPWKSKFSFSKDDPRQISKLQIIVLSLLNLHSIVDGFIGTMWSSILDISDEGVIIFKAADPVKVIRFYVFHMLLMGMCWSCFQRCSLL